MLVVVSPAKKLNMNPLNNIDITEPLFKKNVQHPPATGSEPLPLNTNPFHNTQAIPFPL